MRKALVALVLAAGMAPALAQEKTFDLKISHWVPASHPLQKALEEWGAEVEKDSGGRIKGDQTRFALRFHLHPSVKASRLSDARGVMLVLPNRDVWTFEALDDKVSLEDSVFLAGNDGPRRSAQIVIRQDSRRVPSIRWSFVRSTASASTTSAKRNARREPELPL